MSQPQSSSPASEPIPIWTTFATLPRAHGTPLGRGRLRAKPEDFQVIEVLGFDPDGEGDHRLLRVRKTDANTEWVARRLAARAGVPVSAVGYAGLKDRHAVTEQWFSIPRSPQGEPDWADLADQGIEVLEAHPHRRKLRRGALAGNRFQILIREAQLPAADLDARLAVLRAAGVPNYFGEQRFGHDDGNLRRAHALLTGSPGRVDRHQRGLWLSAARSQLFNELLAERVRRADWDRPQAGDCLQLDGTHSFFLAERIDEALCARGLAMDLHPSGPLWGGGEPPTADAVHRLESEVARRFACWADRLGDWDLKQERRALRLPVRDLQARYVEDVLELCFALPSGAYATAVLRELIDWS